MEEEENYSRLQCFLWDAQAALETFWCWLKRTHKMEPEYYRPCSGEEMLAGHVCERCGKYEENKA